MEQDHRPAEAQLPPSVARKGSANPTADLWRILGHVNEWIRFADTKAAGVLVADGVIVNALLTNYASVQGTEAATLVDALAIGSWVAVIVGAASCLMCLWPRLSINRSATHLYFASIAAFSSPEEFTVSVKVLSDSERVDEELSTELWRRSRVAMRKYRCIQVGIWMLAGSLIFGLALALVVLLAS